MSFNNPKHTEVIGLVTGDERMKAHYCKSYHSLALGDFYRLYGRKATVDDAQAIYNLFEGHWTDYYIHAPERKRSEKELCRPLWSYGCHLGIDVQTTIYRFMEYKYSDFVDCPDRSYSNVWFVSGINRYGYYKESCATIMKRLGILPDSLGSFIMNNDMLEEWKTFVNIPSVKKKYRYHRPSYKDYSHLAYNGVTDDF